MTRSKIETTGRCLSVAYAPEEGLATCIDSIEEGNETAVTFPKFPETAIDARFFFQQTAPSVDNYAL